MTHTISQVAQDLNGLFQAKPFSMYLIIMDVTSSQVLCALARVDLHGSIVSALFKFVTDTV